ncbi:MAG: hypothetical protein R3A10_05820 [Caldilineaceae bacterium]
MGEPGAALRDQAAHRQSSARADRRYVAETLDMLAISATMRAM